MKATILIMVAVFICLVTTMAYLAEEIGYQRGLADSCIQKEEKKSTTKKMLVEHIQKTDSKLKTGYVEYLADAFISAGTEYGVDPFLLAAIAEQESSYRAKSTGGVGERGLMQIHPIWLKELDFIQTPEDLYNPTLNIRAGAKVVKYYIATCGSVREALQCYNIGEGNLAKYRKYVDNVSTKLDSIKQ